jgi:Leucine-rich repeat (LRR) protein
MRVDVRWQRGCVRRCHGWLLAILLLTVLAPWPKATAADCFSTPAGLAGWWPAAGNANDLAGTNNGTLQGGATASAVGMVGTAFSFDGTNSYVQIPDAPTQKPTNLTIECWVRFTGLDSAGSGAPAGDQYLVFKQNSRGGDFEGYDLSKTRVGGGDTFRFLISSSSGQAVQINGATLVTTGVWYHVAGVRGSNFTQLYVNGQLERQTNITFAQDYGTLPLYFGTSGQAFWDRKLRGMLDEVSIYSRALSSNEVAAIYAAGAAGKCKEARIAVQPQSQTVVVGNGALFSVTATGYGTLNYQWQFNGTPLAGATGSALALINVQPTNAGSYTATVTNTLGSATSTVAVLTVLVPPSITLQPASRTNECASTATFTVVASGAEPLAYQWFYNGGSVAGGTGTTLTLTNVHATQQGSYTVVVTNTAGSTTSSPAAILTVVDTTAPVITVNGTNPLTNECHAAFADPGATATDSCAGNLSVLTNSTVNPNVTGVYTLRYTATDPSGNTATNTRTVYVVDTTAPVIALNGANPLTNECHTAFADPGATANDSCAGNLVVITNSTVDPNATGVYTIRYTATDPSGNSATNTRTVYVVDRTVPVIALNGANPTTNECHATFVDPGATAGDTCAGNLGVSTNSSVNPNAPGVYTIKYTAIDPSGNSTTNTRTVYVVDTTAPVITLNGANPMTNECHAAFTDPGATATDACAGSLAMTASGIVNPNAVGVYSIAYTATDPGGNSATNTRTVYVVDTTAPVISLNGANPLTNECHAAFVDPGATASDACAGSLGISTASTVNPNAVGSYAINYTATDPSGNSTTNTRTVYVVDATPPAVVFCITQFTLPTTTNCPGPLPNLTGTNYILAADNCSQVTISQTPPAGTVLPPGTTNLVTLSATDSSSNTTNCLVMVTVPGAPSISLQPTSVTVVVSNNAVFRVAACGLGLLSYQWQHAGTNLPNATASVLTLTSAGTNDAGLYQVVITNNAGSVTSAMATLNVLPFLPIPDPNLKAAVASALAKSPCELNTADLLRLTNLVAFSAAITNISGLGWASNLTILHLGGNTISDLSPLQSLPGLTTLFLYNNQLTNLAPLAGMTNLSYLDLRWNPIVNYEPVLATLTGLTDLYLGGDSVTNVAFLQNLTRLSFLDVGNNTVADLSPLGVLTNLNGLDLSYNPLMDATQIRALTNLSSLYLAGNSISNLLFVTNLPRLVSLSLCSNSITEISPLVALTNLTTLNLAGNPGLTNMVLLSGLATVTNLWLYGNALTNLSFLQPLSQLNCLNLDDNAISDISPLGGLTQLSAFSSTGNQITNCPALSGLTNLAYARLANNCIENIGFLTNLAKLSSLDLDGNRISDVTPLSLLKQLVFLSLAQNALSNSTALSGLTNLLELHLANQIAFSDLSSLAPLGQLSSLDLAGNQVTNLVPLTGLTSLTYLNLNTNRVSNLAPLLGLTNLSSLYLEQNRLSDIATLAYLQKLSWVDLRLNLLDLSPASPARGVIQSLTGRCQPVTVYPDQLDAAPSQRTPPAITLLTPLATLTLGSWPIPAGVTTNLLFTIADSGPGSQSLGVGAASANNALIPNAGLITSQATNGVWTLAVTPTTNQPNTTTITLSATNDVGLVANMIARVTVVTPRPVVIPDPNLDAAVRRTLGKTAGSLTSLDLMALTDLVANSSQITNLSGIEWATNLATLSVPYNRLTGIQPLGNLPCLAYVDVSMNVMNISFGSPAMALIQSLTNRGVFVTYMPQRGPPVISAPGSWNIGVGRQSYLFLTIVDAVATSAQISVGSRSANTNLLPNEALVLAPYSYSPWWTLAVTPTTGLTGTTTITLSATNEVGLGSSVQVLATILPPVGLVGGPSPSWTNLPWLTSANAPWFLQTNISHNGTPAAQSGAIGDGQETWLQTTLFGPGTLAFWEKVSSEPNYDFLEFYIDGQRLTNLFISGEVDWQQRAVSIPSGNQIITWEYSKDESGFGGMDAAWVSEVNFTFTGLWLEPIGPPGDGQFHFVLHGVPGKSYQVLVSSNIPNWSTQATINIPASNSSGSVPYSDSLSSNSSWRFYRARLVQ